MTANLGHEVEDAVEEHVESRSAGDDEGPPPPVVVLPDTHTQTTAMFHTTSTTSRSPTRHTHTHRQPPCSTRDLH